MTLLSTDVEMVLADNLSSSTAYYEQGEAFANASHYIEALANFDKALEFDANNIEALVFRSVMLIHLDRYTEALASCDRALKIQPNHSEALIFRGVALRYLNRCREAYASYDQALGIERQSILQTIHQGIQEIRKAIAMIICKLRGGDCDSGASLHSGV
ncbi:MAG: tetratricopeptide repeat protein [Cyanothece sp. SIO1E1]|nr:tetratricopeptide repeat protein [Cyanothece sp. SIO1E1]